MQEDSEIIEHVLQKDKQAYGLIIDKYKRTVFAVVSRMLGPTSADIQDVAQEVFIKAYLHLQHYKPEHSFPAWLHRIAVNHCLDHLRKRKRNQTEYGVEQEPAHLDTPEYFYLQKERSVSLQNEMEKLGEDYQAVFSLRYMCGWSYQEISDHLGIPVTTVQMRLHRARKKMKRILETSWEGGALHEMYEI